LSGRDTIIDVLVQPRASRNEVVGPCEDGRLKVRVTAPPAGGAANKRLIELLASHFGVPKTYITILSGAGSRRKRVRIEGPAGPSV
jgi:uncharacterized protein (TIGR00251 family)